MSLKLAHNTSPDDYDYRISYSLIPNTETDPTDKLFRNDPSWPHRKRTAHADGVQRRVEAALQKAGVHDYFVQNDGAYLHFFIAEEHDSYIVLSALKPNSTFSFHFEPSDETPSNDKLKAEAEKWKKEFNAVGAPKSVAFKADFDSQQIVASCHAQDVPEFFRAQERLYELNHS